MKNAAAELSDSDYDELVSGDESDEDVKPAQSGVAKILKGMLQEPRFKTISLRSLYEMIQTGSVDLNPDYQREVVWAESRQVKLIQSLFQHYYVPPVIFAVRGFDENGMETRVCIDGKQRCTSVQNFIDGRIPFISPGTKEKFWYTNFPGRTGGKPLPLALKPRFDNLNIQIVEYAHLDMNQQRDIFQRVQLGMPLSAAEKLQALGGDWSSWVVELEKKYISAPGTLGEKLPRFERGRGRPFQSLASLIIMDYDPASKVIPGNSKMVQFLERGDRPERSFQNKFEMTMAIFVHMATDYYDEAFGTVKQRVAPVEFCGIGYLIFQRMNTLSVARLADEASKMRLFLRKRNADIRSNTRVYKDIYEYMDSVPAGKRPGELAAREEFHGADDDDEVQQRRIKKRQREEDDDGTYYDDAPMRGEESAVIDSLRSKQPRKAKAPTPKPHKVSKPTAQTQAPAPANRSPQYHTQPPPAYVPRQPAPVQAVPRPTPTGMDAPNRGPAYVPAPPPNRSPPQHQHGYNRAYRSPPHQHQQYPQPTVRNQVFDHPPQGYQQPPYGRR